MKNLLRQLIFGYQVFLKRWLAVLVPAASHCKFTPSCSCYTKEAIEKYGVILGVGKGMRRILSCHPFSQGGHDPLI